MIQPAETTGHRSLRIKLLFGYFLFAIGLIASLIIIHTRLDTLQSEVSSQSKHEREIANLTRLADSSLLTMESSVQGYALTGNPADLQRYNQSKSEWKASIDQLQGLAAGHAEQTDLLSAITANTESWINHTGDPAIELRKRNDTDAIDILFADESARQQIADVHNQFDLFRNAQDAEAERLISEQDHNNRNLLYLLYILGSSLTLLALGTAWLTASSIIRTLKQATATLKAIADSRDILGERITVTSRDEIGELAEATNRVLDRQEEQNWVQQNLNKVTEDLQHISNTTLLAERFLRSMHEMLNITYGTFYVRTLQGQGEHLKLEASYAASGDEVGTKSIQIGEGLVGQSAKDGQVIQVEGLTGSHIRINTSIGQSDPLHASIVPLLFKDNVVGVLELASLQPFTESQHTLLDQLGQALGTAIQTSTDNVEINRLYTLSSNLNEELQASSEELQAQSEEIQMQSEELHKANQLLTERNLLVERASLEAEEARLAMERYAEQLQLSSDFKSEFVANISHELRTPLNSMLVFSQFLSENPNHNLTDEDLSYIQFIQSAGNDLLMLINDILDLSKVEAGEVRIENGSVSLMDLSEAVLQQFSRIAERKGIGLTAAIQPGTPRVMESDEHRIQQILRNLVSNAIKFTNEGEVALTISQVHPLSKERPAHLDGSKTYIQFTVRDTGIGIPSDKMGLIFEAFKQVDGSIERRYGGTGLGLSISTKLASLLGGFIDAESKEKEGSTFRLYLPLTPYVQEKTLLPAHETMKPIYTVADEESKLPHNPYDLVFAGKKVLIADDDERNLAALAASLRKRGMKVLTAITGQECIALLEREHIDLLLLDVMMPGMNGYQVLDIIRHQWNDTELPVIILTARAMSKELGESLKAGASDYMAKPVHMDKLYDKMWNWLGEGNPKRT